MIGLEDIARQLNNIEQRLAETQVEIATIKRGIYGDPQNKVKGLIETDKDQEARIKSLEDDRKKVKWTAAGLVVGLQGLAEVLKHKIL